MNQTPTIADLEEVYSQTLRLISLYHRHRLTIPFTLKGNLGEFFVASEILKRFPGNDIKFLGGANPGTDITVNDVKIQVKTQAKHPPRKFRGGQFDFEGSPTIKRDILDKRKSDIIALVILHFSDDYSSILERKLYIFGHADFKFFDTRFCWSGKSKGDYTIVNILDVQGTPPKKLKADIDFYNKPAYRHLFQTASNNWAKVSAALESKK